MVPHTYFANLYPPGWSPLQARDVRHFESGFLTGTSEAGQDNLGPGCQEVCKMTLILGKWVTQYTIYARASERAEEIL